LLNGTSAHKRQFRAIIGPETPGKGKEESGRVERKVKGKREKRKGGSDGGEDSLYSSLTES